MLRPSADELMFTVTMEPEIHRHHSRSLPQLWWHYDTSQKVADSRLYEVTQSYQLLTAALGPELYSASNRHEYHQKYNVYGE
jgi:hypothetical protein